MSSSFVVVVLDLPQPERDLVAGVADRAVTRLAEVTGETTRSPHKTFLICRITEALQAAKAADGVGSGRQAR